MCTSHFQFHFLILTILSLISNYSIIFLVFQIAYYTLKPQKLLNINFPTRNSPSINHHSIRLNPSLLLGLNSCISILKHKFTITNLQSLISYIFVTKTPKTTLEANVVAHIFF